MSDDKIDFLLNLDSEEFASKVTDAIDKVKNLQDTLVKVAAVGGAVAAAFLVVKTSLNLTLEAENLKSLELQFQALSRQAGISGDAIRSAMDKAADGLISGADLTKLANKAMVQLGSSANRMPEIMELARKAAVVMGTDTANAFEQISQAVATGQVRSLKQLGIIIDTDKVYRNYAQSLGVAASSLSEQGRIQAVLNEALKQGKDRLKNVDTQTKEATDTLTRFKNTVQDFSEVAAIAFESRFGKSVRSVLKDLGELAELAKKKLTAEVGEGAEKSAAQVDLLNQRIERLQTLLDRQEKRKEEGGILSGLLGPNEAALARIRAQLDEAKLQVSLIEEEQRKAESRKSFEAQTSPSAPVVKESPVDLEKQKQFQLQFHKDVLQAKQDRIAAEMAIEESVAQVEQNTASQKILLEEQTQMRIAEIKQQYKTDSPERQQMLDDLEAAASARRVQLVEEEQRRKAEALDRYSAHAKNEADGIARGFEAGARKADLANRNFGASGQRVFNSFSNHAVSALQAWGAGTESAADAAKGFLFGMLADEAQARGTLIMLSSIWPPNPVGLAAGAGLIALSGLLRSQAGGAGGWGGGGAPSGGAAIGGAAGFTNMETQAPEVVQEKMKKAVTINFEGHYFDTDQSRRKLVEMIQEASDATDFSIRGNS